MQRKREKLADYAATFCVNLAVIGAGLALFDQQRILTAILAGVVLVAGAIIVWRSSND